MAVVNLEVKKGATWQGLTVQFLLNDVAVNLTGATITMSIKKEPCSTTPEVQFSNTDGTIVITNAAQGRFAVNPYVFDLDPRNYYYDIFIEHGNRKDFIVDVSRFEISGTVTN